MMNHRPLSLFAILVVCVGLLVGASSAAAQVQQPTAVPTIDPLGEPFYGGRILDAGFVPDPFMVSVQGGGAISVAGSNLGPGCLTGYINDVPDYLFDWAGATAQIRIFVLSQRDATLVVQTPDGSYLCNDDSDGSNPLVNITNPADGEYLVWVGAFNSDQIISGYLFLSELATSSPYRLNSQLLVSALGQQVPPPQVTIEPTQVSVQPTPTTDPALDPQNLQLQLLQNALADVAGVEYFPGQTVFHVTGTVDYAQTPPVGGNHASVWLNCGVYDAPVPTENAVHSLEHGAIWITYDPTLPPDQVEYLRAIVRQSYYLMLSPFPGVPSPVVASAWGVQLQLPNAQDPRLIDFINQLLETPSAPEVGALCSGGIGQPLEAAPPPGQ